MTQAVLDIRRGAAWLAARPEVDSEQLGITGISLGGIMSALGASGEPRLKNVAVFLGGGTPSQMDAEALESVLSLIPWKPWREATIEAAPGSYAKLRVDSK